MNTIIIGGGGGSSNRRDRQRKDHRWTTLSMECCLLPTGTVIGARPRFRARRRGVPLARAGREECGSISRGATASLCRRIGLVTGAIRKIMETGCSVIRVRAGEMGGALICSCEDWRTKDWVETGPARDAEKKIRQQRRAAGDVRDGVAGSDLI